MPDDEPQQPQPPPEPDEERYEPRIGDDRDPGQGQPVEDDDAPAIGVVDPEHPDPPEPNEPG